MSIFASNYLNIAQQANPAYQANIKYLAEKDKKAIPIETIKLNQVKEQVKQEQTKLEQTKQEAIITEAKAEETKNLADLAFNKGLEEVVKPKEAPKETPKNNNQAWIIAGVVFVVIIVLGIVFIKRKK